MADVCCGYLLNTRTPRCSFLVLDLFKTKQYFYYHSDANASSWASSKKFFQAFFIDKQALQPEARRKSEREQQIVGWFYLIHKKTSEATTKNAQHKTKATLFGCASPFCLGWGFRSMLLLHPWTNG